jgi:ribosome biogenesis GTPase
LKKDLAKNLHFRLKVCIFALMAQAIVIKSTGKQYLVRTDAGIISCSLRGKLKQIGFKSTNPVAVGDVVDFDFDKNSEFGVITKIQPRKNKIVRRSTNLSRYAHILAANIDYAVLVATVKNPKTYPEFIDRFIAGAEQSNIEPIIIFNKIDILDKDELTELNSLTEMYEKIGFKVFQISVLQSLNINIFDEIIADKIIMLSGNSGVGKSSLVNRLNEKLDLKTSEISESYGGGKHTTTFAEMHQVGKGWVIDTPGIKGYGLTDFKPEDVATYFREFREVSKRCKYNNCSHTHEPGCAVKSAVDSDEIHASRYKSYISILNDNEEDKYRLDAYR